MRIIKQGNVTNILNRGCCWPSIGKLEDGKFGVAYSGNRLNHICPFGRVDMVCTTDNGKTWGMPTTLLDTPLDDRDAGILKWKEKYVMTTFNNTVHTQRHFMIAWRNRWEDEPLEYAKKYLDTVTKEQEEASLGSLISISKDIDGLKNFQKLPITCPHGPIALSDGRLFYVGKAYSGEVDTLTEYGTGVYTMYTEDGVTWSKPNKIHEGVIDGYGLHEPHAVECKNGDILVFIRKEKYPEPFTMVVMRSTDGGKTFSSPEETGICGSPPHLLSLKDGRILLSYGRREKPYGIRAKISGDNGYTWSDELILREDNPADNDLGYPCSVETDDGEIITVYYMRSQGEKFNGIKYTLWSL